MNTELSWQEIKGRLQVPRVQTSEPAICSVEPGGSRQVASSCSPRDCQGGRQAPKQLCYQVGWKSFSLFGS